MDKKEDHLKELRTELSELKKSIETIKEEVSAIRKLEESELDYVTAIKSMESKELQDIGDVEALEKKELIELKDMHPKKFPDVLTWKSAIWENCEYKLMSETRQMVLFKCKKANKICSFENCPKNDLMKGEKKKD